MACHPPPWPYSGAPQTDGSQAKYSEHKMRQTGWQELSLGEKGSITNVFPAYQTWKSKTRDILPSPLLTRHKRDLEELTLVKILTLCRLLSVLPDSLLQALSERTAPAGLILVTRHRRRGPVNVRPLRPCTGDPESALVQPRKQSGF